MKLYSLLCFLHTAQADLSPPGPEYAETELGTPRNPPYRARPWLLLLPIGVVFFLGTFALSNRKDV